MWWPSGAPTPCTSFHSISVPGNTKMRSCCLASLQQIMDLEVEQLRGERQRLQLQVLQQHSKQCAVCALG